MTPEERRKLAHQNSLKATSAERPIVQITADERVRYQNELNKNIENLARYVDSLPKYFGAPAKVQLNPMEKKMFTEEWAKQTKERNQWLQQTLQTGCKEGSGCTWTATSFYGPDVQEASGQYFVDHASEKGFDEVAKQDAQPGDLVFSYKPEGNKWRPHHTLMFHRFDENGDMRFNGSNGEKGTDAVRKDARYPAPYDSLRVYRYVGKK